MAIMGKPCGKRRPIIEGKVRTATAQTNINKKLVKSVLKENLTQAMSGTYFHLATFAIFSAPLRRNQCDQGQIQAVAFI
jgi:hypothetical protein